MVKGGRRHDGRCVAGFRLMSRETNVEGRALVQAMLRSAVFVIAYVLLITVVRSVIIRGSAGRSELAIALVLAAIVGLMTLVAAARWRVLQLRVFAG